MAEGRRKGGVGKQLMKVGITMSSSTGFLPRNFAALVRVLGALAAGGFLARDTRTGAGVGASATVGAGIAVCATDASGKCCTKGLSAS